ncbi:MAG: ABA4-like family protein [Pseudomonadota bacterium]
MTLETLFQIVNFGALIGWVFLLASPWIPRLADVVAGYLLPGVFAVIYIGLIAANAGSVEGGYMSLGDVMGIFDVPGAALAGWIHYLAFDLVAGALIVRLARRAELGFGWVIPCLLLTFLVGPIGLLAYLALVRWRAPGAPFPSPSEGAR